MSYGFDLTLFQLFRGFDQSLEELGREFLV